MGQSTVIQFPRRKPSSDWIADSDRAILKRLSTDPLPTDQLAREVEMDIRGIVFADMRRRGVLPYNGGA